MKSTLWFLIHVFSAVVLAVKLLQDIRNTVNAHIANRNEESTRDLPITDAQNDDHGNN